MSGITWGAPSAAGMATATPAVAPLVTPGIAEAAAAAPKASGFLGGIGSFMKENPMVPLGGLYALSQLGGKGDGYDPFSGESAHEGDASWADRGRQLEEEERLFGGGLGSYGHGAEHDFYA